jgi:hypothetical protein
MILCLVQSIAMQPLVAHLMKRSTLMMSTDGFFLISTSEKGDSFQKKNMKIPSLHNSDGIGECPLTCENFFKLP